MPSNHESFWQHESFTVIGNNTRRPFPLLTYRGLKKLGKKVAAVDTSTDQIDGDPTFDDLRSVPPGFTAVVLETPKEETASWVEKVAEAGIKDLWIHMQTETPEALAIAEKHGINARTGTCAVMYVTPGLSFHSLHKWIRKALGRY